MLISPTKHDAVLLHTALAACLMAAAAGAADTLEQQLSRENPAKLAAAALRHGDAQRGAVLFHQQNLGCAACHLPAGTRPAVGPDLTKPRENADDAYLVESVLAPSKKIRQGYETAQIVTDDGRTFTGIVVEDLPDELVLRAADGNFELKRIKKKAIDERAANPLSLMPAGLVNQLAGRGPFLDLLRYVLEINEIGPQRVAQLRPPPGLFSSRPLPEYERHLDHAGLLGDLNGMSFRRGEAIYQRVCANCHGTRDHAGSLPAALPFASGRFKNGADPYSIYRTLTYGFGLMAPQTWMAPREKYDVIHYLREAYLKPHNATQYVAVDDRYLAALPKGDTRGPEPSNQQPWVAMDYGNRLINTYEVGDDGSNFAYKGIALRLDAGPGGVSQGREWMIFDHDTLRVAVVWRRRDDGSPGFIDYNGIHFNGRHQTHPRIVGRLRFANSGIGWANPQTGGFDDVRLRGRDDRHYGPLPRAWGHFNGLYQHQDSTILSYSVGETAILEMPGIVGDPNDATATALMRTFNIGPRPTDLVLQVAEHRAKRSRLRSVDLPDRGRLAVVEADTAAKPAEMTKLTFDGKTSLVVDHAADFDLAGGDFTLAARIRTRQGGAIFCQTSPGDQWTPGGKVFFVRGGRLCYDVGWVGVVESRRAVDDGQWHDVALTFDRRNHRVRLLIDGRLDGDGVLQTGRKQAKTEIRLGYGAPDFPQPRSYFLGDIAEVRFYKRRLNHEELKRPNKLPTDDSLLARWRFDSVEQAIVPDGSGKKHDATIQQDSSVGADDVLVAGLSPGLPDAQWSLADGRLHLRIPAGEEPLLFTLWMSDREDAFVANGSVPPTALQNSPSARCAEDGLPSPSPRDGTAWEGHPPYAQIARGCLEEYLHGGPARWPEELRTQAILSGDDGPFAIDVLTHPAENPWSCQLRFTGFDFVDDGRAMAACTWDGDVWLVRGIDRPEQGLTWRRIASGLFQPLGLKVVAGKIFVGCRDQIVALNDLNGDGETDYYENFNSDHQVTEHFHEFAMGLQTDAAGNFYYAKSARHALPAVVPHHGTLLRVSGDGERTDILATGFRAANGVCVNEDGTFFVTDQEGHWTPKNRINHVEPGGFYGNMFGFHDVTDASDEAMRQPLCWITNSCDRSPGELLWVTSDAWGPLRGSLLELSYGAGKIFVVPHETVEGQMQGGVCALPMPIFPTGVMRGRFHPTNGQLYCCGMFAWAGDQTSPGGFYRVRYTGKPLCVPVGLHARRDGMEIEFSAPLAGELASDVARYTVRVWSLKRTADYGSAHYDEHELKIESATLGVDKSSVFLRLPGLKPAWCMSIGYRLKSSAGVPVVGEINNTIHRCH
ncbi:MAG TPA: DUF6797 domain-containing protein [Pirellulales bacterium]